MHLDVLLDPDWLNRDLLKDGIAHSFSNVLCQDAILLVDNISKSQDLLPDPDNSRSLILPENRPFSDLMTSETDILLAPFFPKETKHCGTKDLLVVRVVHLIVPETINLKLDDNLKGTSLEAAAVHYMLTAETSGFVCLYMKHCLGQTALPLDAAERCLAQDRLG